MTIGEIWMIDDLEHRFQAFIDRWLDLDEFTGNRTERERAEMAEIADAILTEMIRRYQNLQRDLATVIAEFDKGYIASTVFNEALERLRQISIAHA